MSGWYSGRLARRSVDEEIAEVGPHLRLLAEGGAAVGDLGVMVTMGPGAQIETALLQFGQAETC